MNKKMMVGLVTGVAAALVVGVVLKRTGRLDSLMEKLRDLAAAVEDKFSSMDTMGMQDIIPKGEDKNISKSVSDN